MFIKLDQKVIDLLCCPLCKAGVIQSKDKEYFICTSCATQYPLRAVNVGNYTEQTYDFRIQRPSYCIPKSNKVWNESQKDYELNQKNQSSQDRLENYLAGIDSVNEIYTQEFHIRGAVLDVGGGQGRLRHFLSTQEVPLYISIDPYLQVFENIQRQPNLLKAYPSLTQPCNFLTARAEELPFVSNSFDWVHMRSVVDHFEDPYKAFKEAYRVLRPDGNLLIGLAIMEKLSHTPTPKGISLQTRVRLKLEREGLVGLLRGAKSRLAGLSRGQGQDQVVGKRDHHIFRFTHAELKDLLSATGFTVNKEHWQKPPFSYCLYMGASANKITQA
jgi:SAM-dependent methyltransferase